MTSLSVCRDCSLQYHPYHCSCTILLRNFNWLPSRNIDEVGRYLPSSSKLQCNKAWQTYIVAQSLCQSCCQYRGVDGEFIGNAAHEPRSCAVTGACACDRGSVVLPTLPTLSFQEIAPVSEARASRFHVLQRASCAAIARRAYQVNVIRIRTLRQTAPCTPRALLRVMSTLSQEDLRAYLERIRHSLTELKPTLQTLQQLQSAHIRHIPFENSVIASSQGNS